MRKPPFRSLVLLVLFVLLLGAPLAATQAQTHPLMVYTGTGYSGNYCYSDAPMAANIFHTCDDQISSLTLQPGWSVRLYRDQNQSGPSFCLNRSDNNLSDNSFEDGSPAENAISSFVLVNQSWCGAEPTPAYPLEVYTDAGYTGAQCYSWFVEAANIYPSCANQISSVLLRSGWTVRLYRDAGQAGPSRCLTASDANLADNTFEDGSPLDNAVASFSLFNAANCGAPVNQPPNVPNLVAPAASALIHTLTVTLQVQDAGDPDNYPRNYRDFRFVIERSDGSWSQTSPWGGAGWTLQLPSHANYRWRVQAGDGALASAWSSWRSLTSAVARPVNPPQPPAPAPGMWNVPYFWQGDATWASNGIGACGNTIGNIGCALTSLSMIFQYYGANHNPGTLNNCMGAAACPLYWGSALVPSCSANKVRFTGWPASPFSYALLDQELAQGPVILEIRNGGYMHFLVVLGGRGGDPRNYIVNDPGYRNGARTTLSSSLALFKGYQPTSLRLFTGTPAVAALVALDDPPALVSPELAADETITGTLVLYRNTETDMTLQLAAQSSAGAITEMQVWAGAVPSNAWQPFSEFVAVPIDSSFAVRYRDAVGNVSATITTGVPVAPASIEAVIHRVYLPLVRR
jgi:hypothetical protein